MNQSDFERALHAFRECDPEIQCNVVLALLYVARKPGCPLNDLTDYLNVTNGTSSRIVARLSSFRTRASRIKSLEFVEATTDRVDRRIKRLSLTPKGAAFVRRVLGNG